MKRLMKELKRSAEEWGVSPRIAWWIFWLPIAGAIVVGLARANKPVYDLLTKEDGPIEWAEFIFYACACVAAAGVAVKRLLAGYYWQGLIYVGFALGMFFVSGEEIAWGQRILGLQTPQQLAAINHQRELTVHNIQKVQDGLNLVLLLGGAYGTLAFFVNKRVQVEKLWDQANYLLVPPLFTVSSFAVLFGYKLVRLLVLRKPGFTVTRYAEWAELCFAFGLCIFAWLNYRRLQVQAALTAAQPAAS